MELATNEANRKGSEMGTQDNSKTSQMGIIVDGKIHDPNRAHDDVYKTGDAKGLRRFEIMIPVMQLRKIVRAFPNNYKTFPVSIVLVIGQSEYSGILKLPMSRKQDLDSNKVLTEQWLEPWISPKLTDKNGGDVKLAYALRLGGFECESMVKLRVSGNKILVTSHYSSL